MDYFDDVFISFLDKDSILYTFSMEGQKTLGLNLKYLILCSEDVLRAWNDMRVSHYKTKSSLKVINIHPSIRASVLYRPLLHNLSHWDRLQKVGVHCL